MKILSFVLGYKLIIKKDIAEINNRVKKKFFKPNLRKINTKNILKTIKKIAALSPDSNINIKLKIP